MGWPCPVKSRLWRHRTSASGFEAMTFDGIIARLMSRFAAATPPCRRCWRPAFLGIFPSISGDRSSLDQRSEHLVAVERIGARPRHSLVREEGA
jgi:hypothetical protein